MATWIGVYIFVGLIIGCLRQIFRKESVKGMFQEVYGERLEKLANKKEIAKWESENSERIAFSANPDSSLLARAALEAKEDVEQKGEHFWVFILLMAWVFLWGAWLLETVFLGLISLVKKLAKT